MDLEYSKILAVGEDKGANQRKMKYKHKIEKKMKFYRSPDKVMKLSRIGSFHQTRFVQTQGL